MTTINNFNPSNAPLMRVEATGGGWFGGLGNLVGGAVNCVAQVAIGACTKAVFFGADYTSVKNKIYQDIGLPDDILNIFKAQEVFINSTVLGVVRSKVAEYPCSGPVLGYLTENRAFFESFISYTLIKVLAQLLKNTPDLASLPACDRTPAKIFSTLLSAHINQFNEVAVKQKAEIDAALQIADPKKRQDKLKELFLPLVISVIKEVLPNGLSDLEFTRVASWGLDGLVLGGIQDALCDFFVSSYEQMTAPQRRLDAHLDALVSKMNVGEEKAEVRELIDSVSYVVVADLIRNVRTQLVDQKEFIVGAIDNLMPDDKKLKPIQRRALEGLLQEVVGVKDLSSNGLDCDATEDLWGYMEVALQTVLVRLVASTDLSASPEIQSNLLVGVVVELSTALSKSIINNPALIEEERRYASILNPTKEQEAEHNEKLQVIYKDAGKTLLGYAFPNGKADLPIPDQFKESIWSYISCELAPKLLEQACQKATAILPESDEKLLDQQIEEKYGTHIPLIFAEVVPEFAKVQIEEYVNKAKEDVLKEQLTALKGYLAPEGWPIRAQGKLDTVLTYLQEHEKEAASLGKDNLNLLVKHLGATGQSGGVLDDVEKLTGRIIKNTLLLVAKTTEGKDEIICNDLAVKVMDRLTNALERKPKKNREAVEEMCLIALAKKCVAFSGIKNLEGLEGITEKAEEEYVPIALKSILDQVANEEVLNKGLAAGLRQYQAAKKAPKGEVAEPVFGPQTKDELERREKLKKGAEKLLKVIIERTNDPIAKKLFEKAQASELAVNILVNVLTELFKNNKIDGYINSSLKAGVEALVPGALVEGDPLKEELHKNAIEVKEVNAAAEVKHLVHEVVKDEVIGLRQTIKNLWVDFQAAFDGCVRSVLGTPGMAMKKVLDVVCRAIFITTVSFVMRRPFDWLENWIAKRAIGDTENVIKALREAFDRELVLSLMEITLEGFIPETPKQETSY